MHCIGMLKLICMPANFRWEYSVTLEGASDAVSIMYTLQLHYRAIDAPFTCLCLYIT